MSTTAPIQINNDTLKGFHAQNPGFDILNFDLLKQSQLDGLNWDNLERAQIVEVLKTYQRLLRLHNDPDVADKLVSRALMSAHHITSEPEDVFVAEHGEALGLPEDELRQLHRRAIQTKLRTQLLATSLKGTVGSSFYRVSRMANLDVDAATDLVKSLPNYQDFFGSLDYCSCDHDQSIFSPTAYLTDLLRVVDQYIDNPKG